MLPEPPIFPVGEDSQYARLWTFAETPEAALVDCG